ncbi:thioredoxin family protein [Flavobacterium algicola]|uniref:thioredoxin family protein n=1 Tax=Flavobacterium algicola TaxID=556529 RepID=UPI001EFEE5C7|nr:thioredoxin family protein [Flavobacterium algicola]MCG9792890.1 thioredoxin family protein [Flavobacterium algicola]
MKKELLLFLLLIGSISYSQNWKTNFNEAKQEAIVQKKQILLVFSGSDWCAPCIKLDKSIWQSEEFKQYASEELILERADFPKKKQNELEPVVKKQNQELADKYNRDGIFPLVILMDSNGKVLGKTSYKSIMPAEYVDLLKSFVK